MRTVRPLLICAVLAGLSCGNKDAAQTQARLEQQFQDSLQNATLVGKFSSKNKENLAADRYDISQVTRLPGSIWLIHTRVRYGSHDVTVPIPVKVVWAGDTPVITLTDLMIPGLGTFTARVLFYRNEYAGTWSSASGHGGQMFGRIERGKP